MHVPLQVPSMKPAATALQFPWPLTLQRWQVPHPETWQQTPSVQNPEAHSSLVEQLVPMAFRFWVIGSDASAGGDCVGTLASGAE